MKKNLFILLLATGFFCSCGNKDKSSLYLFNNVSFTLLQNEKVSNITSIEKDNFFSYFNEQAPGIPLYRCIKGDSYTAYIALPYNTTIQALHNADVVLCNQDALSQISDYTTHYYRAYKCMGIYIYEYAVLIDNNIVYVLATTSLESTADSLFSFEAMKNRFTLK